jgi:hypothetical protein
MPLCCRCSTPGVISFFAAPWLASLSVKDPWLAALPLQQLAQEPFGGGLVAWSDASVFPDPRFLYSQCRLYGREKAADVILAS